MGYRVAGTIGLILGGLTAMALSLMLGLVAALVGSAGGLVGLLLMIVFLVALLVVMRAVLRVPRLPDGPAVGIPAATRRARRDPDTVPELRLADLFPDTFGEPHPLEHPGR